MYQLLKNIHSFETNNNKSNCNKYIWLAIGCLATETFSTNIEEDFLQLMPSNWLLLQVASGTFQTSWWFLGKQSLLNLISDYNFKVSLRKDQ